MRCLFYFFIMLAAVAGSAWSSAEAEYPETHRKFMGRKDYPACGEQWKNLRLLKAVDARALHIVIYLDVQRGRLYVHEQVLMDFPVCTGDRDHPTPAGMYTVLEKDKDHYSDLYGLAMPCFMRLTNGGIGLHVGPVFREPASHGCIRLPLDVCAAIFNKIRLGTSVRIVATCVMNR